MNETNYSEVLSPTVTEHPGSRQPSPQPVVEEVNPVAGMTVPNFRKERYARRRPFLLVHITRRPAEHVRTEKKGWSDRLENWKVLETAAVVDRVNPKHLETASVIIDVLNAKAIKNAFKDDDRDQIVNHFLTKYQAQITEAMDLWLQQIAADLAKNAA